MYLWMVRTLLFFTLILWLFLIYELNATASSWSWQIMLKPLKENSVFHTVFKIWFPRIPLVRDLHWCWWFKKKNRAKTTSAVGLLPTVLFLKSWALNSYIMYYYTCIQSACFHLNTWELLVSFPIYCVAGFMCEKSLHWNSVM